MRNFRRGTPTTPPNVQWLLPVDGCKVRRGCHRLQPNQASGEGPREGHVRLALVLV